MTEPLHKQKRKFPRGFKQAVPKKSLAISSDHLYLIKHVNEGQIKKIKNVKNFSTDRDQAKRALHSANCIFIINVRVNIGDSGTKVPTTSKKIKISYIKINVNYKNITYQNINTKLQKPFSVMDS